MPTTNEEIKKKIEELRKRAKHPMSKEKELCPSCGQDSLIHEGGCVYCRNCGWGKCG